MLIDIISQPASRILGDTIVLKVYLSLELDSILFFERSKNTLLSQLYWIYV